MNAKGAFLLAGALCLCGCSFRDDEPKQHESRTVDRDNSEFVRVKLDLGGGDLKVTGGTDKLAAAEFRYGAAAPKPEVHYSSAAGRGDLTITQSGNTSSFSHTSKDWDLRFNQDVPLEIEVHMGGGDAHLDLGRLTLRNLDVDLGAGDLDLDLRGAPKKSYDVRVSHGAGDCTVRVPSGVGVEAQASGGIGDLHASGLHHEGNRYFNDAVGRSPVTIHLNVQSGVGDIKLIAE
jgi:hypothetical protein